jgi:hypothetical protein
LIDLVFYVAEDFVLIPTFILSTFQNLSLPIGNRFLYDGVLYDLAHRIIKLCHIFIIILLFRDQRQVQFFNFQLIAVASLDFVALFEAVEEDDFSVNYFVVGLVKLLLLASITGRAYPADFLLGYLCLIKLK